MSGARSLGERGCLAGNVAVQFDIVGVPCLGALVVGSARRLSRNVLTGVLIERSCRAGRPGIVAG
jgi:hypothetical protein